MAEPAASEASPETPAAPPPANDQPANANSKQQNARSGAAAAARAERLQKALGRVAAAPAAKPAKAAESEAETETEEPEEAAEQTEAKPDEEAAPEAEKKVEPVAEDKLAKAADEIVKELRENPEVAGPILKKLLKQGIAGTVIELKKRTREVQGKELAIDNARGALTREREAFEAAQAAWKKEQAEWGELRSKNPREAARRLGLSLRDFADEAARNEEPEEKRQLREVTERLEAERKAREEAETKREKELEELREWRKKQESAAIERENRAWISAGFAETRKDYPYLVAYDDAQILESAYQHLRDIQSKGGALDRARVFGMMNSWAEEQKLSGNWTEAQLKRFAPAANPSPVVQAGSSEQANGLSPKKALPAAPKAAPTLSNADASERASPSRARTRAERLRDAKRLVGG
jgi:hypothetical protein